jgi:branched-chain amino acid transport system ATP-binding protein
MILETRGLHCGYGADEIVHGIDVEIAQGSVVAILGPNGSGKSTFLKAILGYLRVTRGSVRFAGRDIVGLGASQISALGIGYVPQLSNIFKPMTVRENLEMGGYRLMAQERDRRIEALFDLFPLLRLRPRQIAGTLSGGERQLVAMARALMTKPRLLCLDEPSAGLSPLNVAEVFQHIRAIAQLGTSILVIEQDVHSALAVADHGYVFAAGRIAFAGSSATIATDDRMREAYLGHRRVAS